MTQRHKIQLFEDKKVRTAWDDEREEWYFSIVDVCAVLSESENPQTYWRVLKNRLKKEGNETVTNCNALKMLAPDGKMRLTDVASTEQLFRLIQSIPLKKAEPFKQWMAQVARERLAESAATDLSREQHPQGYNQSARVAKKGGSVAKAARDKLEQQLGHSVISPSKAADYLPPVGDVQALPEEEDNED